jgi:hypothetical protein
MESLGADVSQLWRGQNLDQLHLSVPDHFMSKVLSDINVLGSLTSAYDPLDAHSVNLIHWASSERYQLVPEGLWDTGSQYLP